MRRLFLVMFLCVLIFTGCDNSNDSKGDGLVFIQGGQYNMGDHFAEHTDDELPVHEVIVNNFYISPHEVTQAEYELVMGNLPPIGYGNGDNHPAYNMDWEEAATYCNTLSEMRGLTPCYNTDGWECNYEANGYRMPTEAEWEYAARGGEHWEDDFRYSGCHLEEKLADYAWFESDERFHAQEVGSLEPNQLGLYDMSGNVWEMCNDYYRSEYYSSSSSDNPTGPGSGDGRSIRGGSWNYSSANCSVANRGYTAQQTSHYFVGFRVVRKAD